MPELTSEFIEKLLLLVTGGGLTIGGSLLTKWIDIKNYKKNKNIDYKIQMRQKIQQDEFDLFSKYFNEISQWGNDIHHYNWSSIIPKTNEQLSEVIKYLDRYPQLMHLLFSCRLYNENDAILNKSFKIITYLQSVYREIEKLLSEAELNYLEFSNKLLLIKNNQMDNTSNAEHKLLLEKSKKICYSLFKIAEDSYTKYLELHKDLNTDLIKYFKSSSSE